MDTGMGCVLGKMSCGDELLRDSCNGNGLIDPNGKTLRRSRGGAGWEFELHDGISIISLIPLNSSNQLNSMNNVHVSNHKEDIWQIMYTLHTVLTLHGFPSSFRKMLVSFCF